MMLRSRWVLAVIDQGMFSMGNFLLNLLLARWLVEVTYGAFVTSYAVVLLAVTVQAALIVEPMLVLGGRRYGSMMELYLRAVSILNFRIALVLTACLGLSALVLYRAGHGGVALAMLGGAGAVGAILLLHLQRKKCYVIDRLGVAAIASTLYLFLVLGGISVAADWGVLGTLAAYVILGLASLAACGWIRLALSKVIPRAVPTRRVLFGVTAEHARYGKWALGTGLLLWIPYNIYFLVLPVVAGLEANAGFKAVMNLIMPIVQANLAIAAIMLPLLAKARSESSFRDLQRRYNVRVILGCILYWVLLAIFAEPLVRVVYGGRYLDYSGILWLAGAAPLFFWLALAERTALGAIERPDLVFWANAISAVLPVSVGVYLTVRHGVTGAVAGILVSYACMWIVLRVFRIRAQRTPGWIRSATRNTGPPRARSDGRWHGS